MSLVMSSAMPVPEFFSDLGFHHARYLISGRRSDVYFSHYQGQKVVVKVYKPYFIDKYIRRYKQDIAHFEFTRNTKFYTIDALRPYCARPINYFPATTTHHASVFIQEYIDAPTVKEFASQHTYLPKTVLAIGYTIAHVASQHDLSDMDMHESNTFVVEDDLGWKPVLHDFNMVPRHTYPSNPLMWLAYKTGLYRAPDRDYYNLRHWQRYPLR